MRQLTIALVLLAGCTATDTAEIPTYRAGAAKVKITPEKFSWLTGYGNRNKPADGVKHELWARALAIEDPEGHRAVIVTADILGFPPQLSRSIRKDCEARFGLDPAALLLVASHTHGGPAIPERPSPEVFHGLEGAAGKDIDDYADVLRERVLEAVSRAIVARKPAVLTLGRSSASFGMNRRFRNENGTYSIKDNPTGTVDPDVVVLRANAHDGTRIATVFTYACHGTTLGGNVYQYHGDWIAPACEGIEAANGGAPALYATGCGADLNPSPRGTFEMAEQHGKAMIQAVAAAPEGTTFFGAFSAKLRWLDLPLDAAPSRELLEKLSGEKDVYRQRHCREMLKLLEKGLIPASVPLPIQIWRFGNQTMVAIGGETCVEYALRVKKELGASTWVIGYANEVPCYIPSEKVLAESGYEAGWEPKYGRTIATGSMMFYGWPVPFAPGIEDRILHEIHELQH